MAVWPALMGLLDRVVIETLAIPTTYTPEDGAPVSVQGVFDAAYVRVDVGEAGVSSSGPSVFYRLADLPADPELDEPTVAVNGVGYRVVEVKKDGQGGVRLLLHKREE